jgi:hypothetical protein
MTEPKSRGRRFRVHVDFGDGEPVDAWLHISHAGVEVRKRYARKPQGRRLTLAQAAYVLARRSRLPIESAIQKAE